MKGSDDLKSIASHFKSINIPELAAQHCLHELGLRIVKSVLPGAKDPVLPSVNSDKAAEKPAGKRKCPNTNSVPRQTPSPNSSITPSKRLQLDRNLMSHSQTSTSKRRSRHFRNEPYEEGNGGIQLEASSQLHSREGSLEASTQGGIQARVSQT